MVRFFSVNGIVITSYSIHYTKLYEMLWMCCWIILISKPASPGSAGPVRSLLLKMLIKKNIHAYGIETTMIMYILQLTLFSCRAENITLPLDPEEIPVRRERLPELGGGPGDPAGEKVRSDVRGRELGRLDIDRFCGKAYREP